MKKGLFLLLNMILLISCMEKPETIHLEDILLDTNFESLSLTHEKENKTKIFKVNNVGKYTLFGVEPMAIVVFKKNDYEVDKLICEIESSSYEKFLKNTYNQYSTPNVYINLKDSLQTQSETMSWKKGISKGNMFVVENITSYDFLSWRFPDYEFIVKNNSKKREVNSISVEIVKNDKSLNKIKG